MEPITYEPWDFINAAGAKLGDQLGAVYGWFLLREAAKAETEYTRLLREGIRTNAAWMLAQEDAGFVMAMEAAIDTMGIDYPSWQKTQCPSEPQFVGSDNKE